MAIKLGDVIQFEGKEWVVVGDNSESLPHPNGQKHWDYIIKYAALGVTKRIRKEELPAIYQ